VMTHLKVFRTLLGPRLSSHPALSIKWIVDGFSVLGPSLVTVGRPELGSRANTLNSGCALMGVGNFFNHSCISNLSCHSDMDKEGSTLRFVACRDIGKGEELTISYCSYSAPRRDRQCTLSMTYGFQCACMLCVTEEKLEQMNITDSIASMASAFMDKLTKK
jgi:hypothetical protein